MVPNTNNISNIYDGDIGDVWKETSSWKGTAFHSIIIHCTLTASSTALQNPDSSRSTSSGKRGNTQAIAERIFPTLQNQCIDGKIDAQFHGAHPYMCSTLPHGLT